MSFAEALHETDGTKRHLLVGNGFSISLFPDCFSYASLFQEAKDKGLFADFPQIEQAFEILGTTDFELVMKTLKAASKLSALYGFDGTLMAAHAERLKEVLVEAIAGRHPSRPNDVTEDQFRNCRAFLSNFIGIGRGKLQGKVFSVNYDLLLYWTILHDTVDFDWKTGTFSMRKDEELIHDDGFRAPEEDYDAEYVAWEQFSASHRQTIMFLHGALHLYERGPELAKLCWERSGNKPLMDQIRAALDDDKFPLFVSEGTSKYKMARINRSAYLSKASRSFSECCKNKSAALFVIGHSLDANDDHILRHIKKGSIGELYVSMFGDPNSDSNKILAAKANSFVGAREEKLPLTVQFVDAGSLHIWDHP